MLRTLALTVALLAAGAVSQTAVAVDDSPCDCWSLGYADAAEWRWEQHGNAETFKECASKGMSTEYEAGFKTREGRKAYECPYSQQ